MKHPGTLRLVGILGLLLLVLAGCAVRGSAPPVQIGNFSYYSSLQDRSGRFIICDNLETRLVYSFDYLGYLESWESVLVGEETGEERGRQRFVPAEPVSGPEPARVSVTYTLLPRSAPLAAQGAEASSRVNPEAAGLEPSSIIVEPIRNQGSRIEVRVRSRGGYTFPLVSRTFPVVSTC